ncbi:MAG: hypothetical protein JST14_04210 [Bacteroidetes bacterium]|nr:hypothetical protein [Bacteroidota bacterium]
MIQPTTLIHASRGTHCPLTLRHASGTKAVTGLPAGGGISNESLNARVNTRPLRGRTDGI